MEEARIPIETFDALLRDLMTWDLVVRGEGDNAQNWSLVARAQRRLGELATAQEPWPPERTAYVGRRCADCHRRQLTWARDGAYLCDPCFEQRLGRDLDEPTSVGVAETRGLRWVRRHHQRVAS
ncbi:MAG: hypothetical protein ABSF89_16585 [Acidimicrobiales bacterium]